MGSNGSGNQVFGVVIALLLASLVLLVIGLLLHRRGKLTSRPVALGWAILTILPLFGGGFLYATRNIVNEATGKTPSGVNVPPNRGAP